MQRSLIEFRRRYRWRLLIFFLVVFALPAVFLIADGMALSLVSHEEFRLPAFAPYLWLGLSLLAAIRAALGMRQYANALKHNNSA